MAAEFPAVIVIIIACIITAAEANTTTHTHIIAGHFNILEVECSSQKWTRAKSVILHHVDWLIPICTHDKVSGLGRYK